MLVDATTNVACVAGGGVGLVGEEEDLLQPLAATAPTTTAANTVTAEGIFSRVLGYPSTSLASGDAPRRTRLNTRCLASPDPTPCPDGRRHAAGPTRPRDA